MTQLSTESRNWSMLAHFSAALAQLLLPSFGFLGPLLVWLLKRKDADVAHHARQAFAFQLAMALSVWILGLIGTALSCFVVGWVLYVAALAPWLAALVLPVLAGIRVNNGEDYAYPITGPMVPRRLPGR